MIYIERIHNRKKEWRMNLPPQLCREMGIAPKDQFLIYPFGDKILILQKITDKEIVENGPSLENLKIINYGQ